MKKMNAIAQAARISCMVIIAANSTNAFAQNNEVENLETVEVTSSADASKSGLMPVYAGGQVGKGSRNGILGNKSNLESPFSTTSYTQALIEDKQAKSVGDVLQNDPTVRVARGFGNFQQAYFIRGFASESDDTLYNGLYGILPRQYIASELFERVEVLRGASTFLNGAAPGGGNIGGTVSVLPKRAPNNDLNKVSVGYGAGNRGFAAADIARRFGDNKEFGVRLNVAHHGGKTSIDREKAELSLISAGLDWRGNNARVSADIGFQDNKLKATRTNVTLAGVTQVPAAPKASSNWAQNWSYSNERDVFGTVRAEYDIAPNITAYAAYGMRRSKEANSLANLSVSNNNGNGTVYRFDNARKDSVNTGEIGVRADFKTGNVSHNVVLAANRFELDVKNAYLMDFFNSFDTNLYNPVLFERPNPLSNAFTGNYVNNVLSPAVTTKNRLTSVAIGDTLSMLDNKLLLTLGLRWQQLDNQSFAYGTGASTGAYKKSRTSPALGAVYKITPQLSVYGNYVESLAAGGTAPTTSGGVAVANGGQLLSPYVSKQKEIGLKYEDGRFGAGLALFSTNKPRSVLTSNAIFTHQGKDTHNGAEFSAYGQVSKNMRLLGGLVFLDAKQKLTGDAALDGKRVIGVPKLQGSIGAEYEVPQLAGLAVDGRLVYTGASYADAANELKVKGWGRFDIGARYITEISGREVAFRFRIDNVTNKKYWASVGGYPGSGYLNAGAPRSFSFTASIGF